MEVTAMRSNAGVTAAKKVLPASVRLNCDWARLNKLVPNQVSRVATCLLTAPCVTKSSLAALVKLTCRAAASKALTAFKGGSFLIPLSYLSFGFFAEM